MFPCLSLENGVVSLLNEMLEVFNTLKVDLGERYVSYMTFTAASKIKFVDTSTFFTLCKHQYILEAATLSYHEQK